MPFDRSKYPDDWEQVSYEIRHVRAGLQCEWIEKGRRCEAKHLKPHPVTGSKVVLTVAHLAIENPMNVIPQNLMAMCQMHHFAYDRRRKRNQMTRYIGICGPAQHGKDSTASVLTEEFDYTRVAFADALKEIAFALDPIVFVQFEDRTILEPPYRRLSEVVERFGWDDAKNSPEVRQFLQRLGTEAGRQLIDENLWLNLHEKRTQGLDRVVITDVRFENEAQYVIEKGGIMISVFSPGKVNTNVPMHASEQHFQTIRDRFCTYNILNNGTLEELHQKIRRIMVEINGA